MKVGENRTGRFQNATLLMLLLPSLLYLGVFFIYPLVKLLSLSVYDQGFTLKHFGRIFEVPTYAKVLWITFRVSFVVTFFCLILGYMIAYLVANVPPRVGNILLMLVIIPFWTSVLVRTYAWMVILGRQGVINQILLGVGVVDSPLKLVYNALGVYIGMVQILLPYMVLPIYSVMKGIDKNLIAAARNLGASPFWAFLKVYFPLSLPGVFAGTALVFILSLGFYITPTLLGGLKDIMISKMIERHVNEMLNWNFASAMGVTLLLLTAVTFILFKLLTKSLKIDSPETPIV